MTTRILALVLSSQAGVGTVISLQPLEKGTAVSLFPVSSSHSDLSLPSGMGQSMGGGASEHFR